jgi:hypothetical protein
MKLRVLLNFAIIFAVALISYNTASAQIVEKVKKAADKTTEVTIDTTKKTVELTKDATDKTKNSIVEVGKKENPRANRFGSYTVELTDNVRGQTSESGRWLTVTTWNGMKWISKRTWIVTKKAADKTRKTVVGDRDKQP